MKISVNTLRFLNRHYGSAGDPAPHGVDALVKRIGAQLGAVEEVIPFGERFKDVLIAKVVQCRRHENSDHLNVCSIDDGGTAQNVTRDASGYVQVVCGAPNVREGLLVAWLPPGATVPESIVKGEPFVLEARALRGEMSNGMLASARELTIGDDHDGILEITPEDNEDIKPGASFAETYGVASDVVIDIENKMFTHRPDCFGWLGVAREIEGIHGRPYKSPDWYRLQPDLPGMETEELQLAVQNDIPEVVPRFMAVALRDVHVGPSPLRIQLKLVSAGLRPINNIVDYTNYFMLETGQPLHAYDYDKVAALSDGDGAALHIRNPRPGEKIALLNGKTIEPRAEAIMIATDKQLIGVGGVMGGADTEVDAHTRNIILECATFDMYSIRKTSMTHGLFSDAVTRNNKGQSPLQNAAVIAKITDEIRRFAGGVVASRFIDDNHVAPEAMERGSLYPAVSVSAGFINARLGLKLIADDMATLLTNVEFGVEQNGEDLTVTAPFWRTDIEIPEDIVEEVGRLYGFDHLPLELPKRDITPAPKDKMFELKATIREVLSRAGGNEVLTYSFVHGKLLDNVGQDRAQAFQLNNALSPDLQYYRLSLLPSLLDKVHANVKAGYDEFVLFEMGKAHNLEDVDADELPNEQERLALVYAADDKFAGKHRAGAPYYQARKYAEMLLRRLGIDDYTFVPYLGMSGTGSLPSWKAPFAPGRTAVIMATVQGHPNTVVGFVGEYKPEILQKLKLPAYSAGFELDLVLLHLLQPKDGAASAYTTLPNFPKIEQDMCLRVPSSLAYHDVFEFILHDLETLQQSLPKCKYSLTPVDIYQRPDDPEHKQITLRLSIASYEKTLRDEGVSRLLDSLAEAAKAKFQAERI